MKPVTTGLGNHPKLKMRQKEKILLEKDVDIVNHLKLKMRQKKKYCRKGVVGNWEPNPRCKMQKQ